MDVRLIFFYALLLLVEYQAVHCRSMSPDEFSTLLEKYLQKLNDNHKGTNEKMPVEHDYGNQLKTRAQVTDDVRSESEGSVRRELMDRMMKQMGNILGLVDNERQTLQPEEKYILATCKMQLNTELNVPLMAKYRGMRGSVYIREAMSNSNSKTDFRVLLFGLGVKDHQDFKMYLHNNGDITHGCDRIGSNIPQVFTEQKPQDSIIVLSAESGGIISDVFSTGVLGVEGILGKSIAIYEGHLPNLSSELPIGCCVIGLSDNASVW